MKNTALYIKGVVLVLLLVINSCTDYLEIDPTDRQTTENFYKTSDDAFKALMGIYQPMTFQGWENWHDLSMTLDFMSDDCYKGGGAIADGYGWAQLERFIGNSQTPTAHDLWYKCYLGISRANVLLSKYDDIEFKESEAAIAKSYQAEALFLRAHYHLEAVRLFENIPLLTDVVSSSDWRDVEQSDVHATYAQIASDMLDAIENLPESYDVANLARITKWAAKGELARGFLFYTGYYQKNTMPVTDGADLTKENVLNHLTDIIESGKFSLQTDYHDMFIAPSGDYSSEMVFEIPYGDMSGMDWNNGKTGNVRCVFTAPSAYTGTKLHSGWAFVIPTHEFNEQFEAGDLRKDASIITAEQLMDPAGTFIPRYQHTGLFCYKYTSHDENYPTGGGFDVLNYQGNYHYIRFADVLLMAAELDMGAQGITWLNLVRSRAGLPDVAEINIDIIYQERRSELAMEGVRYWDVLRRGLDFSAEKLTVQNYELKPPRVAGVEETGDVGSPGDYERVFDMEKKGFLPIPQYELDLNLELIQNDGY